MAGASTQTDIHIHDMCVCAQLLSHVWLFGTPQTVARQTSVGVFPGRNTEVGYHFLPQEIFLSWGSHLLLLPSPALAGRFFTTEPPGKISDIYHSSCSLFLSTFRNMWTFINPACWSQLQLLFLEYFSHWEIVDKARTPVTHSHPRPVIQPLLHDEIKYL